MMRRLWAWLFTRRRGLDVCTCNHYRSVHPWKGCKRFTLAIPAADATWDH